MPPTPKTINTGNAAAAANLPRIAPAPPTTDPDVSALLADNGSDTPTAAEREDIAGTAHPNTRHINRFWRLFCLESLRIIPTAADVKTYDRGRTGDKTKKLADVLIENRDPLTGLGSSVYTRASFKAVQSPGRRAVLEFAFMGNSASQSAVVTQDETAKEERQVFYRFVRAEFLQMMKTNPQMARAANYNEEDVIEDVNLFAAPTTAPDKAAA